MTPEDDFYSKIGVNSGLLAADYSLVLAAEVEGVAGKYLYLTEEKQLIIYINKLDSDEQDLFKAALRSIQDRGVTFISSKRRDVLKKLKEFKPEFILFSAGFDAHTRDPLAHINLESENYNEITKKIIEIANTHSQGRVISFLEGGYDLFALSESIKEHFLGLTEN